VIACATFAVPVAGTVTVTVGGGFSTVVNVHECGAASGFPAMSASPTFSLAV
jgi:hypothetical protein